MAISEALIQATIVAMTIQATLTGVYLVTFLLCLRWLIFTSDGSTSKDIEWPKLIITLVIFAFSVTDFGISLKSVLFGFNCKGRMLYTGAITELIESLTAIITDGVLIFRCWVLYSQSYSIVVLPSLLLLYNISALIVITYWNVLAAETCRSFNHVRITHVHDGFLICTIVINIYATSAIIVKIWRMGSNRQLLLFTTRVVAESGLLYTITSIFVLCAEFIRGSPQGSTILLMMSTAINFPTAGIAYSLIVIRVAQRRADPKVECVMRSLEFITVDNSVGAIGRELDMEKGSTT